MALGHFMVEEFSDVLPQSTVLELASGTGYLGLSLSVRGASKVVMSDKECMIPLLHANVLLNSPSLDLNARTIEAVRLDWNNQEEAISRMEEETFDFIVISDVFYEVRLHELSVLQSPTSMAGRDRRAADRYSSNALLP
eukprot:765927-Hanusia_phi.AAC.4